MADGQSIFGTDTSKYQPLGTYDPGAFEIVNVDDPGLAQKVATRNAAGIPWGVYLWVYPGHDLASDARSMIARVRALGLGDPPAGYWADYEDAGITPAQLDAFFAATDQQGVKAGYYSGPSAIDHNPFLSRPWWNAAYPTGQVAFPGYGSLYPSSRPRPMNLWQYTSAGGLDRNVVVDEAWWSNWIGAGGNQPAPPQTAVPLEVLDMILMFGSDGVGIWRIGDYRRKVNLDEWNDLKFQFKDLTGKELKPFAYSKSVFDATKEVV